MSHPLETRLDADTIADARNAYGIQVPLGTLVTWESPSRSCGQCSDCPHGLQDKNTLRDWDRAGRLQIWCHQAGKRVTISRQRPKCKKRRSGKVEKAGDFDPFALTKLLATDSDRTNTGGR